MIKRKDFLRLTPAFGLAGTFPWITKLSGDELPIPQMAENDREYWVQLLDRIAEPILGPMSRGELRKKVPMEYSPAWDNRNKEVAYMEAFGRLLAGIAPFLALPADDSKEGKIRQRLVGEARSSLNHSVDPSGPDYLYWGSPESRQPLVDAAYIAQALITATDTLWKPLPALTKERYIGEFKRIRQIIPYNNNWVLFAAMIESFLLKIGEEIDSARVDKAIETIITWYAGDGWYKDGEAFHFDHYNGYVIHPMLTEILRENVNKGRIERSVYETAYKRMQRYAHFQERFISPEGYYPVFGRSSTYRSGAFWPLAKLALEEKLPEGITGAQVRCGLTAVLKNLFIPSTFNSSGCLTLGLVGDQQANLADYYSNTGSMYISTMVFWALGLPAQHAFWTDTFAEWTQRRAWSGKPFPKDYAVNY